MAYRAVSRIKHDGVYYEPGDVVPAAVLNEEQEESLLDAGAIYDDDKVPEPEEAEESDEEAEKAAADKAAADKAEADAAAAANKK
jgi:hypothetical protein